MKALTALSLTAAASIALGGAAEAQAVDVVCNSGPSSVTVTVNPGATWNNGTPSTAEYRVFGYQAIPAQPTGNGGFTVEIPHNQGAQGPSVGNFTDGNTWLEIAEVSQSGCEGLIVNGQYRGGGQGVQSYLQSQGLTSPGTFAIVPEFFGPGSPSRVTVGRSSAQLPPPTESGAFHFGVGQFAAGLTYTGRPSLQNIGSLNAGELTWEVLSLTHDGQWVLRPATYSGGTLSYTLPPNTHSFIIAVRNFTAANGQQGHLVVQVEQAIPNGVTPTRYTSGGWVDPTRGVGYAFEL